MIPRLLTAAVCLLLPAAAWGQSSPPATAQAIPAPDQFKMTVRPTPTTRPALTYSLVPPMSEVVPGNAATHFLMAFASSSNPSNEEDDAIDALLNAPNGTMSIESAAARLSAFGSALKIAGKAARRESCEWDIPYRTDGFATMLPHLQHARTLAKAMALKARMEIAQGKHLDALSTLQTGFAMVRALNRQAVLVTGLVSAGIASLLTPRVIELSQSPGSPNLYWALRSLPHPLIDEREMMRWEQEWVTYSFPALRDVTQRPMSADQWADALGQMFDAIGNHAKPNEMRMLMVGFCLRLYPDARRYWIAKGVTLAEIEALPAPHVVGVYLLETYRQAQDDLWKWWLLPFPQAVAGSEKFESEIEEMRKLRGGNLLAGYLLPSTRRARSRFVMLERRIAALEIVESVRDFAARNGGRIPASLADLKECPVSDDPSTGKPFGYEARGSTFIITSPAPPNCRPNDAMRIEVTVQPN